MKRNLFVALALLITALVVPATRGFAALTDPDTATLAAAPGEFLIKFRDGTSPAERTAVIRELGGELFDRIDSLSIAAVRVPVGRAGMTAQAAADMARAIAQHPAVEFAEPNGIFSATEIAAAPASPVLLPLVYGPPLFVPNDPGRSAQYAWSTINAFQGWGVTRGTDSVIVAVVDSGVQITHPDLAAKLVRGYDFVTDDDWPDDENGHGTHVAGTVGAITNNGMGVAGTCPECRIMAVRVLDSFGNGYFSDVAAGISWAVDHGAKAINLSLSGPRPSAAVESAIDYAWRRGAVVVCAAGNGWNDDPYLAKNDIHPAAYPTCLGVAATTGSDTIASFSNRGTWVDLAAPGQGIYSTMTGSSYAYANGTSMASPHIAGVAGLLASQGLTNTQIRDRLCATADPIAGTGTNWACGRLNLLRAVRGN